MTEFGEILDLAVHLQEIEGESVIMHIFRKEYKKIGDGIIEKIDNWAECLGEGWIWVFDGCAHGRLQDWLRERGEFVFGGSEKGDALENDRQLGQAMFTKAGFKQPESHNFKAITEATAFVKEHPEKRWILKQNGDAPKHLNHMAKFEGNIDLIYHLNHLEKSWNESDYGKFDCDLMEIVDGIEVAATAFFNGTDWLKDSKGKVVGYLNFEEKKEATGGLGETCGEMGTTFIGVNEDNEIFEDIIMRPEIRKALTEAGFRGVFDINGCILEDGEFIGFEPTCRFGVPSTAYTFCEGLESSAADLLEAIAKGLKTTVDVYRFVGMVMVVAAKPFPIDPSEQHVDDGATSVGEKLWLLKDGLPIESMTDEQTRRIHLFNFFKEETSVAGEEVEKSETHAEMEMQEWRTATNDGYLLTVTAKSYDLGAVRDELISFIKSNVYISGMKWRTDIGVRAADTINDIIHTQYEKKDSD